MEKPKEMSINRVKQIQRITIREHIIHLEFKKNGSMLLAIQGDHIKLLSFFYQPKQIRNQFLQIEGFLEIAYSQRNDRLVSINGDYSIQSWKEQSAGYWIGSSRIDRFGPRILSVLLNNNEDLLITGYLKGSKFWKVNNQTNKIEFYQLVEITAKYYLHLLYKLIG